MSQVSQAEDDKGRAGALFRSMIGDVYRCSWIAEWDEQVYAKLCTVAKKFRRTFVLGYFGAGWRKELRTGFLVKKVFIYHTEYRLRSNQRLHRDDGPTIEWIDGPTRWYRNGMLHRDDGQALEYADGHKEWYRNGELHRDGGPAVEHADGTTEWYRDGKRCEKQ